MLGEQEAHLASAIARSSTFETRVEARKVRSHSAAPSAQTTFRLYACGLVLPPRLDMYLACALS